MKVLVTVETSWVRECAENYLAFWYTRSAEAKRIAIKKEMNRGWRFFRPKTEEKALARADYNALKCLCIPAWRFKSDRKNFAETLVASSKISFSRTMQIDAETAEWLSFSQGEAGVNKNLIPATDLIYP